MSEVSDADDRLHAVADSDPLWSETAWFGFSIPQRNLGGTVYPLFRPNLGVCSLSVYVWDDTAHEPWRVPYGRAQWHLPMPEGDLTRTSFGGLELECVEPLHEYRVRYRDGDALALDLHYRGLIEPHGFGISPVRGHIDQPCHVRGTLALAGETLDVDGYEMRDRSWHVRDDRRSTRASYSYGIESETEMFLAGGFQMGDDCRIVAGFLIRDGEKADWVGGTRRVIARHDGYPTQIVIEANDALGRRLEAHGSCRSRLANQATPGMFAWMSLAEWTWNDAHGFGEDQDVWSPDLLPA
jgi:hypothetical protein